MSERTCSIPDCGGKRRARGFCVKHYLRATRNGDPLAGRVSPGGALAYFERHRHERTSECKIWPFAKDGNGYGQINLGGGVKVGVHVLACTDKWGPPATPGMDASHGPCHMKSCWNADHLSWKTRADNLADKKRDGTQTSGVNHPASKLTDTQVVEIRTKVASGMSQRQVAEEYGVHPQTVHAVIHRKTWRHVQ